MFTTSKSLATLALVAVVTACGGGGEQSSSTADSASRDLTLPEADSLLQPQLTDVPETVSAPVTASPAQPKASAPKSPVRTQAPTATPTPAPVAEQPKSPATGVIAAGTTLALLSDNKVCTNTNKVGDRFTAKLSSPVAGTGGAALPAGTVVSIEVTQLTRSENKDQQIVMGFRVVSFAAGDESYTPDAEVVNAEIDRVAGQSRGEAAKKVVGGAAAGVIVGQILGRDRKGTLIGAAVGAAAGAAAAASSSDFDGCVDVGAAITVKLNAPLTVKAGT